MEDEVLERHRRALNKACATMGLSITTLMENPAGSWYVDRVEQQLQNAAPPTDLSLAISNAIELAADLPADQRRTVQGIGIAQLLGLAESIDG